VRSTLTGESVPLGELAQASIGLPGYTIPNDIPGLEATEHVRIDAMAYSNACAVVELEVDENTGAVKLLEVTFAHDCGTVIHPQIVEGQVMGGIAHGIGNSLFEWMRFDENAQPITTNLAEYMLPTAFEMPHVKLLHLASPSPLNELGIKGVGESGVLPMPAAIASAIDCALSDLRIKISQVPVFPNQLLDLIHKAKLTQAHQQIDCTSR
jgi:carbon-monoxide dehydrogenase large subunit